MPCLWEKRFNKRIREGYSTYPVLEDNKEEECSRGCGASRTVAGKVMCGQKGIDSQEAEQLAGCLVVGEAPIFQEGF